MKGDSKLFQNHNHISSVGMEHTSHQMEAEINNHACCERAQRNQTGPDQTEGSNDRIVCVQHNKVLHV